MHQVGAAAQPLQHAPGVVNIKRFADDFITIRHRGIRCQHNRAKRGVANAGVGFFLGKTQRVIHGILTR